MAAGRLALVADLEDQLDRARMSPAAWPRWTKSTRATAARVMAAVTRRGDSRPSSVADGLGTLPIDHRDPAAPEGDQPEVDDRDSIYGRGWLGIAEPSWEQHRVPILDPAEVRRLGPRRALVVAEMYDPIIAHLWRSIDGRRGRQLLAAQARARRASGCPPDLGDEAV